MRQGCVIFNMSFLPLLEEIAMEVQSWPGPVMGGSSPGHRAGFLNLMHCSMLPRLSPTTGSGWPVWPSWGQVWHPGILGTSSGLKTLWRGLGGAVQGKELDKRQTLPFEKKQ